MSADALPTDRQLVDEQIRRRLTMSHPYWPNLTESDWCQFADTLADRLEARLDAAEAARVREEKLREALEDASHALGRARNGLDLGLGCARDLEGCEVSIPGQKWPRSSRAWSDLEDARRAQRSVRAALAACADADNEAERPASPGPSNAETPLSPEKGMEPSSEPETYS